MAAGGEFGWFEWVVAWSGLQQTHGADWEAMAETGVPLASERELGAAAAGIHEQQGRLRELRISTRGLRFAALMD